MMLEPNEIGKIILPRLLTLVTCNDGLGGLDAIPSDTIVPISATPSIIMITISPSHKIFKNIVDHGEFVVNMLSKDHSSKMLSCLKNYPRGINKLEQVGLGHYSSEKVGSKRVKEAKLWVECKLNNSMKAGENMLVFGEVLTIEAHDDIVVDGKADIEKLNPPLRISESGFSGLRM